jgi:hypothetical protein
VPESPAEIPVSPELAEVRDAVRRLEAQAAVEYRIDTPEYWRAMSERLEHYLAGNRFAPAGGATADHATRRAYHWLERVTAAYRALAVTGASS